MFASLVTVYMYYLYSSYFARYAQQHIDSFQSIDNTF